MNRRDFLQTVGLGTVAGIPLLPLLQGCSTTGLTVYHRLMQNRRVELILSDFPELSSVGGAVEVSIERYPDPVVVVRKSDVEYVALLPVCTHLGCTVYKEPTAFRCPCHGSTYALNGAVVRGPAEKPLAVFHTEVVAGSLFIHLS